LGNHLIAWQSIYQYLLKPTINLKIIAVSVLVLGFWLRQRQTTVRFYERLHQLSLWPFLLFVLMLAFSTRLFWVSWSQHIPPASIVEDKLILEHAQDLAAGRGYVTEDGAPTALRPIGYPLFVASLFRVFGESMPLMEWIHVLLGVLSVFLIYYLGKQIHSEAVGIFAAFLFSIHPTAIMSTELLMDEHLFIPLWLLSLVVLLWDYHKPALWKVGLAGFILGISAEVRTYSVVTLGSGFLAVWIGKKSLKAAVLRSAVLASFIVFCALHGPSATK